MSDLPMVVSDNNGFGGAGLGTGFIGGLVLGSIWNGNGFGWGNRGNGAPAYDAGLLQGISNQIQHTADAVNNGTISQLQSSANTNMMIAGSGANIANAISDSGRDTQAGLNAVNVTSLQNTQQISNALCNVNQNITNQGYEARLQTQQLAAQLAEQHASLSRQIFEENCKDRELARELSTQALRDKLAESQTQNSALLAQINLTNQLTAQTAYLVSQLKPETTTPATATGA